MRKGAGKTAIAFSSLTLMLSACGGGDGGGTASFTSWSSIQPSSTVVAQGQSQTYTYDPVTGDVIGAPLVSTSPTATMSFDADGDFSRLILRTSTTTIDLDLFAPLGAGFVDAASSIDAGTSAIMADPRVLGFEYQTFGIWETDFTASVTAGAFSVGAPTVGSNIPTTGGATFTGNLNGLYVDGSGDRHFAFGEVIVGANFVDRTLAFSTQNTFTTQDFISQVDRPELALSGTLRYDAGINRFTGSVDSVDTLFGHLSGTSSGQFYGPSAQELGGVFFLQASDPTSISPETYSGAYGAERTIAP